MQELNPLDSSDKDVHLIEHGVIRGNEFGIWKLLSPIRCDRSIYWTYGKGKYKGLSESPKSAILEVFNAACESSLLEEN